MLDKNKKIAFIGAGNMAGALIEGLLAEGFPAANISAADTDTVKLDTLAAKGVNARAGNAETLPGADALILAVKPQVMREVLIPLGNVLALHPCLLVSIAAGIPMANLQAWSHPAQAIVRCMPNTPALVGCGATALYANDLASEAQKTLANDILSAVGLVNWLPRESDMDAVTALSGSGPAYFFLLMECMQAAAVNLGLDAQTANRLCLQTALGAARLAQESDVDVGELRRRVTSPGGTTEAALKQFESDGFNAMVGRALERAAARSRELAATNDGDQAAS